MWWFIFFIIIILGLIISFGLISKANQKERSKKFYKKNTPKFIEAKENYASLIGRKGYSFSNIQSIPISKQRSSAIYAIYFPVQDVKEIIPIYVSKAKDVREEWFSDIDELNEIQRGIKKNQKYEKILDYAKSRNLKIEDLRFKILKSTTNLNFEESEYIKTFGSDIYGFNVLIENEIQNTSHSNS